MNTEKASIHIFNLSYQEEIARPITKPRFALDDRVVALVINLNVKSSLVD